MISSHNNSQSANEEFLPSALRLYLSLWLAGSLTPHNYAQKCNIYAVEIRELCCKHINSMGKNIFESGDVGLGCVDEQRYWIWSQKLKCISEEQQCPCKHVGRTMNNPNLSTPNKHSRRVGAICLKRHSHVFWYVRSKRENDATDGTNVTDSGVEISCIMSFN